MTDRLDRIEAITESNARAIAAFAERQEEFANRFDSFIQRMDQQGLQVTLIRDLTDDQAGELIYTQERTEDNDIRIDALRADAIADRAVWRAGFDEALSRADADRAAWQAKAEESTQRFEEAQRESNHRFEAMQENIQQLFRELIRTNHRVDNLEQAS